MSNAITLPYCNALINVKPEGGGGTPAICEAFDFFLRIFDRNPHPGVKNMVQIRSNRPILETNCIEYQTIWPCICEFYYTLGTLKCRLCLKCVVRSSFIITDDNLEMTVLFNIKLLKNPVATW